MIDYSLFKNNRGILISLVFLAFFLPISIASHTGYKEDYINYFITASLLAPIAPLISSKNYKQGFYLSIKFILLVIFLTIGYWWYRDLPKQTHCDGACGGQFSFENEIDYGNIILAGISGTILGVIIRFIKLKFKAAKRA